MNKIYIIDEDGNQHDLGELKEITEADLSVVESDLSEGEAELEGWYDGSFECSLSLDHVAAFKVKLAFMGKEYWKGKVPQRILQKVIECHMDCKILLG